MNLYAKDVHFTINYNYSFPARQKESIIINAQDIKVAEYKNLSGIGPVTRNNPHYPAGVYFAGVPSTGFVPPHKILVVK